MVLIRRAALITPFVVLLVVYLPAVGRGFILDDYRWVIESRAERLEQIPSLFLKDNGFYRPIIALTFAADYALFGNHPRGYGLTNLALAFICAALLGFVASRLGLPRGAAMLASALWILNFHGIPMALLWISGRTALVMMVNALVCAWCVLEGRLLWAGVFCFTALLSKEDAIALPIVLAVWIYLLNPDPEERRRRLRAWLAISLACVCGYAILRFQTFAYTPWTAPPYYRFTFQAAAFSENLLEYADRVLTFPAAVTLAAVLILGMRTRGSVITRNVLWCGIAWIVGGLCITVFLPVRSSLYACLPSAGACIIAADVCAHFWNAASPRARTAAMAASIIVAAAVMGPVHYARARKQRSTAEFSTRTLADLSALTAAVPEGALVVLRDDPARRPNLRSVFGTLADAAVLLQTGRRLRFSIESPPSHAEPAGPPRDNVVTLTLVLDEGVLRRASPTR